MRVTISAPTFDPLGYVELDATPDSDVTAARRRVSRVATLDGGVAVNDFGASDGDREFRITFPLTTELERAVTRMLRLYARVTVCTAEGVFTAAMQDYRRNDANGQLTILPIRKTSED